MFFFLRFRSVVVSKKRLIQVLALSPHCPPFLFVLGTHPLVLCEDLLPNLSLGITHGSRGTVYVGEIGKGWALYKASSVTF